MDDLIGDVYMAEANSLGNARCNREFYQCLETGYKDTEIRSGWQSTGNPRIPLPLP